MEDESDKTNCNDCGVEINQNEVEAYDCQCRQCFRNNFESEED